MPARGFATLTVPSAVTTRDAAPCSGFAPFGPLVAAALDTSFDLPYTRLPHPKYRKRGPIPAYEMIKHSINMHRGCFGGCSFCTISAHQGKFVASRSKASILREVESIKQMPDFRGTISDLGGPSGVGRPDRAG